MIIRNSLAAVIGAATLAAIAAPVAKADSIADVEGARMKDHSGWYTTRQEREKLRRYGGNDDGYYGGYGYGGYGYGGYGYRSYGGYGYGAYGGPGVTIYVGPGRAYGPYGY